MQPLNFRGDYHAELAAWKRHPDTFFGELRKGTHKPQNWLEMAKFMHKTYRNTPREKLLDWMKGASDCEQLATLSQEDLAIAYCERTAWSTWTESTKQKID